MVRADLVCTAPFLSRSLHLPFVPLHSWPQPSRVITRWYDFFCLCCRDHALTNGRSESERSDARTVECVGSTVSDRYGRYDGAISTCSKSLCDEAGLTGAMSVVRITIRLVCTELSRNMTYPQYHICLNQNCYHIIQQHHKFDLSGLLVGNRRVCHLGCCAACALAGSSYHTLVGRLLVHAYRDCSHHV